MFTGCVTEILFTAAAAPVGAVAGFCAGCCCRRVCSEVVSERRNSSRLFCCAAAAGSGLFASFRAGGIFCLSPLAKVMAKCCNRLMCTAQFFSAAFALDYFIVAAGFRTGCRNFIFVSRITRLVAKCRNLVVNVAVAAARTCMSCITGFRAGRSRYCIMIIMSKSRNHFLSYQNLTAA